MAACMTKVHLLNVPLESDQLHTLYFISKAEQSKYFLSRAVYSEDDFSYQRKDKVIRYPRHIDALLGCNYVMYQNTDYTDRWYYAFITKMEYVNDNHTDIYIETDAIQTWLRDYHVNPSFVEREHVEDDTPGLHTVPEQLETGDYVVNSKNMNNALQIKTYVMAATVDINSDTYDGIGGDVYNGMYSGVRYFLMNPDDLTEAIADLAEATKIDAITSIFCVPSLFCLGITPGGGKYPAVIRKDKVEKKNWVNTFGTTDKENLKPTQVNGYTPNNNKLLSYPYTYMLMSNNSGGAALYKYELFNNPDDPTICPFNIYGAITPGMSIRLVPRNYNGVEENNEEGLNMGKYPICGWNSDVYTNWLTQNGVNIGMNIVSGLFQIGAGISATVGTGGVAAAVGGGTIAGGVSTIANTLGEVYQHSKMPPQAEGNLNSGDVTFASGNLTFTAYSMSIKKEYAQILDGYFDAYGYKVNRIKIPNYDHRAEFWYTKTVDVNIDGAIPMEDIQKIKDAYNRGITFWKNPANIGNYAVAKDNLAKYGHTQTVEETEVSE